MDVPAHLLRPRRLEIRFGKLGFAARDQSVERLATVRTPGLDDKARVRGQVRLSAAELHGRARQCAVERRVRRLGIVESYLYGRIGNRLVAAQIPEPQGDGEPELELELGQ